MIDPSAFSHITGQIDYSGGRKKMPLKPGELEYGENDQPLTWKKAKQPENPIAQRDRSRTGYDGLEAVRATEALREQQLQRARKGTR